MGVGIKIIGKFRITEYDKGGNAICETEHKNVVTNNLKIALSNALVDHFDSDAHSIGFLAVGEGNVNAPLDTDDVLEDQIGGLKEPVPGSVNNDVDPFEASATFHYDAGDIEYYGTWRELGLYSKDGTILLTRALIDPEKVFDETKRIVVTYGIEIREGS